MIKKVRKHIKRIFNINIFYEFFSLHFNEFETYILLFSFVLKKDIFLREDLVIGPDASNFKEIYRNGTLFILDESGLFIYQRSETKHLEIKSTRFFCKFLFLWIFLSKSLIMLFSDNFLFTSDSKDCFSKEIYTVYVMKVRQNVFEWKSFLRFLWIEYFT